MPAVSPQGATGAVAEIGSTRALRVENRPLDGGTLGHFRMSFLSGTMAAGLAAGSDIFQFIWSDAAKFAVIHAVTLEGLSGSATSFVAGFGCIDLIVSRNETGAGAGGSAVNPNQHNNKSRTSSNVTVIGGGGIRVATTAALTPPTRSLDSRAIGQISLTFKATSPNLCYCHQVPLLHNIQNNHPLILARNDAFFVRATVPATGTWQFGIGVVWSETLAY